MTTNFTGFTIDTELPKDFNYGPLLVGRIISIEGFTEICTQIFTRVDNGVAWYKYRELTAGSTNQTFGKCD